MKKSTFLGSAVSVLLLFSAISYSRTFIQQQNPKSNPVAQAPAQASTDTVASKEAASAAASTERPREVTTSITSAEEKAAAAETYTATAYSLHGRTATGVAPATGMIAADPRVLPLGSRVRIEAGSYSGEYVVADTGGAVKGHRIDIWTPTSRDAMRFGRRAVKLTVLEVGGKRKKMVATRPRTVSASNAPTMAPENAKPQKY
jgi:3D (Asp-Asp-Asp) domain-containing protein